jgi:hypothetical protein
MYYLSQNIGEAQKIVASGAAAATRAIGRLEARFEQTTPHEPKRNKRVSDAPKPPEQRSRGTGGKFTIDQIQMIWMLSREISLSENRSLSRGGS